MALQIIQDFIPKGSRNRPAYKLAVKYITIHDTANTQVRANAKNHAAYLKGSTAAGIPSSWHFTVDDKMIYQHLPLTENGWHCGDGTNGPGNRTSIGIEICENSDGGRKQAEENAAWLTAKLLKDYGLKTTAVKQHYNWSGKNCPRVLRGRVGGWAGFLEAVELQLNPKISVPSGSIYRVQVGAYSVKANAEAAIKRAQAAGFKDAFIVVSGVAIEPVKPAPIPTPKPKEIIEGSKVKVTEGAKDYSGTQLASFVYNRDYDVIQISGDRVVIGTGKAIVAAVHRSNLVLV